MKTLVFNSLMVIKKVLARLTTFFKFRSKSSRSQGQKYWYPQKSLVTINTHVKYQSSNSHSSNIKSKIKVVFFKSKSKVNKFQNIDNHRKVLSKEILMWNIKAIAPTVQRLLARLNFSKSRSNSKVRDIQGENVGTFG